MEAGNGMSTVLYVGMFAVIFVLFYFVLIRPQKKREKEMATMRSSLKVGDVVVTIGGVVGLVTSIKEDVLVLETGSDRSKIRIKKWAIQAVEQVNKDQF